MRAILQRFRAITLRYSNLFSLLHHVGGNSFLGKAGLRVFQTGLRRRDLQARLRQSKVPTGATMLSDVGGESFQNVGGFGYNLCEKRSVRDVLRANFPWPSSSLRSERPELHEDGPTSVAMTAAHRLRAM